MLHVAMRGYSVLSFAVKLDQLTVVAKITEKCLEHPPPINVLIQLLVPLEHWWKCVWAIR